MKDFDQIMQGIVAGMAPVRLFTDAQTPANNIERPARFYWGRQIDLPAFLKAYKDDYTPLIWSVPKIDKELAAGYQREAEFALCHRETRDLLNTDRIDLSFNTVLYPLWGAFARAIDLSGNASIVPETTTFLKFPNFIADERSDGPEKWDCLKIGCRVNFNEDHNC